MSDTEHGTTPMTSLKPAEYCEDFDAVEDCVNALFQLEKQFGTSAFMDAVDELTHDRDYQARENGARPLTTAWFKQKMLHAVRDDDALVRHVEEEEARAADPFPGQKGVATADPLGGKGVRPAHTPGQAAKTLLTLSLGGMSLGLMLTGVGLTLHSLGMPGV